MAVATYTKSGAKAATPAKLDKSIFGVEVTSHQLLKDAYLSYLAAGRTNNAVTKKRGQVSGSTIKPWRQKGTGNARFGSRYNPIWRGGGIVFGPTGDENYSRKLTTAAKRQALRQALSMAAKENRIKVIDSMAFADGKVKPAVMLLDKLEVRGKTLLVVSEKNGMVVRATNNIPGVKAVQAKYLNVYDIMNSDNLVIEKSSLEIIKEWLGGVK